MEVRSVWKVLKSRKNRNLGQQVNNKKAIKHMHHQAACLIPNRYVLFDESIGHLTVDDASQVFHCHFVIDDISAYTSSSRADIVMS
mmetsp:Transcript_29894/g.46872  ORF Transcript_29894/g.46872 Transcript_29894/m.46872 type:complete len:86 (+) Transcript_29894:1980-2237(+)